MRLKAKRQPHRSIGQWCQEFWSSVERRIRSLAKFALNWNRREVLGRNAKRWSITCCFLDALVHVDSSRRQTRCLLLLLLSRSCRFLLLLLVDRHVTRPVGSAEIHRQGQSIHFANESTLARCLLPCSRTVCVQCPVAGLSFRPQAAFDRNDVQALIRLSSGVVQRGKRQSNDQSSDYARHLDEFFRACKCTVLSHLTQDARWPALR